MGAPMARRLLKEGHRVSVFNRSPEKARRLAGDGATVVDDPVKAVSDAEIIFIMVPDTPDVEATISRIKPRAEEGPTRHRHEHDFAAFGARDGGPAS